MENKNSSPVEEPSRALGEEDVRWRIFYVLLLEIHAHVDHTFDVKVLSYER